MRRKYLYVAFIYLLTIGIALATGWSFAAGNVAGPTFQSGGSSTTTTLTNYAAGTTIALGCTTNVNIPFVSSQASESGAGLTLNFIGTVAIGVSGGGGQYLGVWYAYRGTSFTGTSTFSCTAPSGGGFITTMPISYTGLTGTLAHSNSGNGNGSSASVSVTSTSGDAVIGFCDTNNGISSGAGFTQREIDADDIFLSEDITASGSSTAVLATPSANNWACFALDFPVASAAGVVVRRR